MISFIRNYWYLLLFVFVLGIVFNSLLRRPFRSIWKSFRLKSPTIKNYWYFILFFVLFAFIAYYCVFKFLPDNQVDRYLNFTGQLLILIFAIGAGYLAFLQVVENRIDKLKEEGVRLIKEKSYFRAIKTYEQLCSINAKNFSNMAELLELYLIQKDFVNFDLKIQLLKKNALDYRDHILFFYLKTIRYIFQESLVEARSQIENLIKFRRDNPSEFYAHFWDFSDLKESKIYSNLKGDPKRYTDNFISYLNNELTQENKSKFENGDYILLP